MPAYGKPPFAKSIYPGQNTLAVGYPAIAPGGPSALAADQPEVITAGYKSIPVCVAPAPGNHGYTQRQLSWQIVFGVAPSVASLILQGSINDVDAEYQTVDTSTSIAGETRTINSNMRFFRVLASALTGTTSATVKITAM